MTVDIPDLAIDELFAAEDRALAYARSSSMHYPPLNAFPVSIPVRSIDEYKHFLAKPGVNRTEAEFMVTHDLIGTAAALRTSIFPLPDLNDVRHAVLLHVGFYIGVGPLKAMTDLWSSLRKKDYETAEHELLSSVWPMIMGPSEHAKRRVLDLARSMRTGELPAFLVTYADPE